MNQQVSDDDKENDYKKIADVLIPSFGVAFVILPSIGYFFALLVNVPIFLHYRLPMNLLVFDTQDLLFVFSFTLPLMLLVSLPVIQVIYQPMRASEMFLTRDEILDIFSSSNRRQRMIPIWKGILRALFFGQALITFFTVVGLVAVRIRNTLNKNIGFPIMEVIILLLLLISFLFIFVNILKITKKSGVVFSSSILFVFGYPLLLGYMNLQEQNKYFININNTECLILYMKSDRAVCAPYNRSANEVEDKFRVIYFSDNPNLEIAHEIIGSINLKPTSTPTVLPTLTPTATHIPLPTNTIILTPSPTP